MGQRSRVYFNIPLSQCITLGKILICLSLRFLKYVMKMRAKVLHSKLKKREG